MEQGIKWWKKMIKGLLKKEKEIPPNLNAKPESYEIEVKEVKVKKIKIKN